MPGLWQHRLHRHARPGSGCGADPAGSPQPSAGPTGGAARRPPGPGAAAGLAGWPGLGRSDERSGGDGGASLRRRPVRTRPRHAAGPLGRRPRLAGDLGRRPRLAGDLGRRVGRAFDRLPAVEELLGDGAAAGPSGHRHRAARRRPAGRPGSSADRCHHTARPDPHLGGGQSHRLGLPSHAAPHGSQPPVDAAAPGVGGRAAGGPGGGAATPSAAGGASRADTGHALFGFGSTAPAATTAVAATQPFTTTWALWCSGPGTTTLSITVSSAGGVVRSAAVAVGVGEQLGTLGTLPPGTYTAAVIWPGRRSCTWSLVGVPR